MPPDEKPEGEVIWINGYYAWDDERNDFLWVSGIWRTPPPSKRWVCPSGSCEASGVAVTTAIDDILAYTAQRLRNRIAALTPGTYTFTTYLDDDGGGNEKAPLTVTVRVADGRLDFDFAGTAPQSRGALNVPESGLKATVFYAVKALLEQQVAATPHARASG
jgi:hypothetical protein